MGTDVSKGSEDTRGGRTPPKRTRFQKGTSGNPRGRPKRIRTPQESARWALRQKVTFKGSEGMRQMSFQEAILLSHAKDHHRAALLMTLAFSEEELWQKTPEIQLLMEIKANYVRLQSADAGTLTDQEYAAHWAAFLKSMQRQGETPPLGWE